MSKNIINAQKIKKSSPKKNIILALINAIKRLVIVFMRKYDLISHCICSNTEKNLDFSHHVMSASFALKDLLSRRINTIKKNIIPAFFTIEVTIAAVHETRYAISIF